MKTRETTCRGCAALTQDGRPASTRATAPRNAQETPQLRPGVAALVRPPATALGPLAHWARVAAPQVAELAQTCAYCCDRADGDDPIVPALLGGAGGATAPTCASCRRDRSRLSASAFAASLRARGVDVEAIGPRLERARQRRGEAN